MSASTPDRRRWPLAFAERNKAVLAVVGLAVLALIFVGTLKAESLPVIGGGDTHQAYFAEAGGLKEGTEVRVAGVDVGKVTGIELDEDRVLVTFRVEDVELGSETRAAVKIKTLLGRKYLALDPAGRSALSGPIPVDQTTTPYDVTAALEDLSTNVGEIDTDQMARSLDVLSDTFEDTPPAVQAMVSGLTDLSRTVSSRDDELAELLDGMAEVSGTVAAHDDDIAAILDDGSTLLGELAFRRQSIHHMLTGSARLGTQVKALIRENEDELEPALDKLDQVAEILSDHQDDLDASLRRLGPYYRMLASAMGNGRWVDAYLCGLFDKTGAPLLENDVVRNCHPGGAR